jgi:hypothetical protein
MVRFRLCFVTLISFQFAESPAKSLRVWLEQIINAISIETIHCGLMDSANTYDYVIIYRIVSPCLV